MSTLPARAFWGCVGGIAYVYAGYPALLALANKVTSSSPVALVGSDPTCSLIIAAFNEELAIADKIENSLELEYPDLEIVVVADGSDDATVDIARRYEDRGVVVLFEPERRGKSAALNRGVEHARGEILVFSDANNHFDPQAIRQLASAFADPRVGGATGQKTVIGEGNDLGESEGLYWRYESAIRKWESDLGSCTAANGEILAVRARDFAPIPPDVINDDLYLAMTILGAGRRFVYAPGAVSRERPADSAASESERRARMTAGRFQLVARRGFATQGGPLLTWQFLSHKVGRLALPFLFLGAFGASVLALFGSRARRGALALGRPWAQLFVAAQVGSHLVAMAGERGLVPDKGPFGKAARILGYVVSGNISTLEGFRRFIGGRQTVLWDRVGRAG